MNWQLLLLISAVLAPGNSYADPFLDKARLISARLKGGVPFAVGDPNLNNMVALLKSGQAEQAAAIASNDPDFYDYTLRQFAAAMLNRENDERQNGLNDFITTIIGTVRDNAYFGSILYMD